MSIIQWHISLSLSYSQLFHLKGVFFFFPGSSLSVLEREERSIFEIAALTPHEKFERELVLGSAGCHLQNICEGERVEDNVTFANCNHRQRRPNLILPQLRRGEREKKYFWESNLYSLFCKTNSNLLFSTYSLSMAFVSPFHRNV